MVMSAVHEPRIRKHNFCVVFPSKGPTFDRTKFDRTEDAKASAGWKGILVMLAAALTLVGTLSAQDRTPGDSSTISVPQPPFAIALRPVRGSSPSYPAGFEMPVLKSTLRIVRTAPTAQNFEGPPRVRRITLEQAQQQATTANNPMARLGQLQVEAAHEHTLAAESDYFPKISSMATNFHFNKFMGALLTVNRPIAGGTITTGLPLAGKDQTLVDVTAAQPLTPLFKLHEVVTLARTDENIARAKAGMPVETADNIEENYYKLLVAQRRLTVAEINARQFDSLRLVAANSGPPEISKNSSEQLIKADDAVVTAATSVKELTALLNEQMGWPLDTELELVPPPPHFQEISLTEATNQALATNPEIVEAEQNVVKARAATTLSKLDYVPDVAVLGGYVYNSNAVPLLPRDFTFIGVMGSYTVFDFGKREHTLKERKTQLEMAELAVQLTKAKVATSVKNSYFELQRSRELSDRRHQMTYALQLRNASLQENEQDATSSQAQAEADMFEADFEYSQALAKLKGLMGAR
jgi:outer membrane protein TolC